MSSDFADYDELTKGMQRKETLATFKYKLKSLSPTRLIRHLQLLAQPYYRTGGLTLLYMTMIDKTGAFYMMLFNLIVMIQ